MATTPIQHQYDPDFCHCYGCGRMNEHGLQLKSYWLGEEAVARFTPKDEHMALPGFVYGGLLASLVDCHGVGTAAAVAATEKGGCKDEPLGRYVTAALQVTFRKPTPLGPELVLRGRLKERRKSKLVIGVEIEAEGEVTVRGEVVAAPMPASMG
ncbi:PaaI family thioesterase [Desulfohalobium retbaense]|uniref:Thioesterase superfamily protein n=1 Tax=Desulfohalobium retbaense (strain ATCC 49708 / DSM 5692 / JCM 16813 / HR100) TaxID=485915 RepID=C8X5C0_DESRD|nr:PaaI family thioesterase [Desulfohalobium retbaense]ACV69617.1 thioesterase superfamily protein [Desulfohalobium retbaense DSM 5692]